MSFDQSINGYEVQSELGRGGMAMVYLAHDNKFDTNVAIKVLNKEFVHNDNIRKRFLAEAKSMFKMSHPNIIKVTDLIDEGDTVAFVMEYIEGETLKEYIDRKGKLKDDEIKTIFSQMLDAVGYVHEQNLVHRDIKPSNFMIDKKGKVKLMDFGIAKTLDASSSEYTQTGTGAQMGTPMYMSPEQITETKSVTAQSDIYSLGVVLWQMVTGQKPYDTKTLSNFQLQIKIVNDALPLTRNQWDAVISKATAKEVQARYSSVSEFSKALYSENIAHDNHDTTVVSGGLDETVVQKDHDKTIVDDAPKKEKDISLKERFAIASRNESSKQTDLAPTKNSSVATNIQVSISFEGVFTLIDHKVNVYADDIKVGTGSLRNGFHLNFIVYRSQPILVVSILFKRKKIAIPKLEIGKKYEITIDFDRYIKGNFNSKPKEIRVLSIPSVE